MARRTGSRDNSAKPRTPLVRPPKVQAVVRPGPIVTHLGGLSGTEAAEARRWAERADAAGSFGRSYIVRDDDGVTATGMWDPIFD